MLLVLLAMQRVLSYKQQQQQQEKNKNDKEKNGGNLRSPVSWGTLEVKLEPAQYSKWSVY